MFQKVLTKINELIFVVRLYINQFLKQAMLISPPQLFSVTDGHSSLYEIHVTIQETADPESFKEFCQQYSPRKLKVISCKAILIELPVGTHKQQPMCSIYFAGTFAEAREICEDFSSQCKLQLNQNTTRHKIEMRFLKVQEGLPVVNQVSINSPLNKSIYWEFHIKLFFDQSNSLEDIQNFRNVLVKRFGAYVNLSRSVGSTRVRNSQFSKSRIVTVRIRNGTKQSAKETLGCVQDFLLHFQNEFDYIVDSTESELSIYDTNISLDSGWV